MKPSGEGTPNGFNRCNLRPRRTLPKGLNQEIDFCPFPFDLDFDPTIFQVAGISLQLEIGGASLGEIAVADPLNRSGHKNAAEYHLG